MKRMRKTLAALCLCLLPAGYAPAEEKPESLEEALEEVVVVGEKPISAASSRTVREQDFELRPKKILSDILRLVPDLFIAQHAGGGKGDQIFLRGFDNDHGTDVTIFIDDIPVNMRSHAHGQGYADLHFVIPEVLKTVEVYKANLIFGPWRHTEFYLNFGTGFHSDDARAVVTDSSQESLPRAYGYEVGVRSKLLDRIDMALSLWTLRLESELVLVGDEGTVEPRGTTRRWGLEVELRYKISDWLWLSSDFSWTEVHFLKGNDAVPFAPRLVHQTDVTVKLPWGLEGGLELRNVGQRYAIEDRSSNASGYTQFDLQLKYRWKNLEAFITLLNMADREYPEAQHFFESRLPGEPGPVEDIYFTPGASRAVYGGIAFRF